MVISWVIKMGNMDNSTILMSFPRPLHNHPRPPRPLPVFTRPPRYPASRYSTTQVPCLLLLDHPGPASHYSTTQAPASHYSTTQTPTSHYSTTQALCLSLLHHPGSLPLVTRPPRPLPLFTFSVFVSDEYFGQ